MHFVCACMQFVCIFRPYGRMPMKSRAGRTFSRFVCSVCSRFGSSSFFRRFPFKANAYNAYKCIQGRPKTALSPTADWDSSVCTWLGRELHTASAYGFGRNRPRDARIMADMAACVGRVWLGRTLVFGGIVPAVMDDSRAVAAMVRKNGFQRPSDGLSWPIWATGHVRYGRRLRAVYGPYGGRSVRTRPEWPAGAPWTAFRGQCGREGRIARFGRSEACFLSS